ncbi:MAG: aminotransferase class V-fold PLP-dependent enzyme [Acidobacteria bacterium]|nr:aminotransferase class V-fold PLP-dependent enzyme [Acidobacteriota bacterium]
MELNRRSFLHSAASLAVAGGLRTGSAFDRSARRDSPVIGDRWAETRAQFLLDPGQLFFNTGTLGSCPIPVMEAVKQASEWINAEPTYGYYVRCAPRVEAARVKAARLIGCSPTELTITHSTTEGMNAIARGLGLRPRDEVVITTHEHHGGEAIWQRLESSSGVKLTRVSPPDQPQSESQIIECFDRALGRRKPRLVSVSHILYTTGMKMPVKALAEWAHARKALLMVDGAHPVGLMPVDVRDIGCDFYVASGQKWLCGPPGTGLLYARAEHLERLEPFIIADTKVVSRADAQRINYVWTDNVSGIVGLGAAIDFHTKIGAARVLEHDLGLIRRFNQQVTRLPEIEFLSPIEDAFRTPMTALRSRRLKNTVVFQRLKARKITVKEVVDDHLHVPMNAFRVATHIFNSDEQIDRLVETMREVL